MIQDAAIPAGLEPIHESVEQRGILYSAARWTPQDLGSLAAHLDTVGRQALAGVAIEDLLDAWSDTVATFRDVASAERCVIDPPLARLCQLSLPGLDAGLQAVLGGVSRGPAGRLAAQTAAFDGPVEDRSLIVVVLAANLPALAVQSLLPAVLLRRPILLKSPTAEPLFAPAFLRSLLRRLPAMSDALAAVTWKGGDRALEAPILERAGRILAYGEADSLDDLEQRAPGKVFGYGPRTSLAVVAAGGEPQSVATGLARDVALFDQRGCLSVQAIFTDGDAESLAAALGRALVERRTAWPPGIIDPVAAAGVQQIRSEAALRGLPVTDLPIDAGTVLVEPEAVFRPSPGLRTVRVHPLDDLRQLPEILSDWSGRLQGAALDGDSAWSLRPALADLGISRFAPPGQLQTPDALWHNGGVHPFTALSGVEIRDS